MLLNMVMFKVTICDIGKMNINMTDKIEKRRQPLQCRTMARTTTTNVDGKGFCCNDGSLEAAQTRALARAAKNNFQEGDAYEMMQFYYHPDHLGSSSYITNLDGEVVQHIEYVPFGEVLYSESESYSYMNNRGQRVMETLSKEEAATVGLNHVKKNDITENDIRKDQGLNPRGAY